MTLRHSARSKNQVGYRILLQDSTAYSVHEAEQAETQLVVVVTPGVVTSKKRSTGERINKWVSGYNGHEILEVIQLG